MRLTERLKYPLSIFVVWHPSFKQGKAIADSLYSIFCRNVDQPLSRGLGIPVYYRSVGFEKKPIPINKSNAVRNAIILLVDINYFTDPDFSEYTEYLASLVDENTRIYPIALYEHAYDFGHGLKSLQFIRAYFGDLVSPDNFELSLSKIKTELLNDCARLLMHFQPTYKDKEEDRNLSKIKLFLSHAKKDGLETTKEFKAFVVENLKIDVFFDTVDIADGYDFEQQIEANIKNAALVVFHTDEYSAREWCRIEVLIAKRNKCSIVVVHDIKHGEKRAFPYLGNTPTITVQEDRYRNFTEIVNLTLYQVINNLFQLELLEAFHQQFSLEETEFISLTSPPELFNYIDIYKKKEESKNPIVVLYPEPPLGAEELKILNELDKDIKFITPILLPTLI